MSAEGLPLVELLREALGRHEFIEPERDGAQPRKCKCGIEFKSGWVSVLDHRDHLADVTASVFRERLAGQRETVAVALHAADWPGETCYCHPVDVALELRPEVDAALAALDAEIGGDR